MRFINTKRRDSCHGVAPFGLETSQEDNQTTEKQHRNGYDYNLLANVNKRTFSRFRLLRVLGLLITITPSFEAILLYRLIQKYAKPSLR